MDPRITHHQHAHASTPPLLSHHQRQLSSTPSSNVFSKMSAASASQAQDALDAAPLPNTDHWSWRCCRCNNNNMGQPSEYGSCPRCMHERCLRCRIKWGGSSNGSAQWFEESGSAGDARKEDGSRKGESKGEKEKQKGKENGKGKGKMFFLGGD